MKIGLVTTSRADFGIYMPVLDAINRNPKMEYLIFVGGMHLCKHLGYSVNLIEEFSYDIKEKIESLTSDDSPKGVSISMGNTIIEYGKIWNKYCNELDLVFVLGDRFEMFSAAASLVPFNIPIAHLHGGETTLGAIDNKFRHAITAIADYHFVSHEEHSKRVSRIIGSTENIYNVGAPGLDLIKNNFMYSEKEFEEKFSFNVSSPYLLVTYHPETINLSNDRFIAELISALQELPEKVLCTLPNADTQGMVIRKALLDYQSKFPEKIFCFDDLDQKGYFTAMKYSKLMIGNTSSGIIEAASFNRNVINVGDRQKGRMSGSNVVHVANDKNEIIKAYNEFNNRPVKKYSNPYGDGGSAEKIVKTVEDILNSKGVHGIC